MGAGLCGKCKQLLNDFVAQVKTLSDEFEHKIKEFVKELSRCCCIRRTTLTPQGFTKIHKRNSAYVLLQYLNTDNHPPLLNQECLQVLSALAASENQEVQEAASMYYLHVSQQLESPLPVAFLEPYRTLLLSIDLGAQRAISLSLVNLLVKKNVCDEVVIQMGMLVPILEMFQSADPTVQCNSSACVAMLASSEPGREAVLSAEGVIPLLVLAKSYDPRVQQNAVWALFNLTQSETSVRVLCQEGGIPLLALLLQSSDSEVQFNSCSALSNIAVFHEHHSRMLAIGDQFLLKSLVMLTSSSVQKNSSQACRCLRILSGNVLIQSQLMELDCVASLRTLLFSPGLSVVESAIALLSELAAHPANQEALVDDGLLEVIGQLLLVHRCSDDIIRDSADVINNLCTTSRGQQGLRESECVTGLLSVLVSSLTTDEALVCVALCLHKLTSWELLQSHLAAELSSEHVDRLVTLSGQMDNQELSYNSASIISKLQMNDRVICLLQPHYPSISEYLLVFLENQDVRFQHLGLATLCNLKDGGFAASAGLEEQLVRVHLQTERTRNLLQLFQQPPPSPELFQQPPSSPELFPQPPPSPEPSLP